MNPSPMLRAMFAVVFSASAAGAAEVKIETQSPVAPLADLAPTIAVPLTLTSLTTLSAPAPALRAIPFSSVPVGAAASVPLLPAAAASAVPAAAPAPAPEAAGLSAPAAGAIPQAEATARAPGAPARDEKPALSQLHAQLDALQGRQRQVEASDGPTEAAGVARIELAGIMTSFRQASKSLPRGNGIADIRAARLAAAAAISHKPIDSFTAAYEDARHYALGGVDLDRAARLSAAATASGTPLRTLMASYWALQSSPYSITADRAARLASAAALAGVAPERLGESYIRTRAAVASDAQDAAVRLTLTAEYLGVPSESAVGFLRQTRGILRADGADETAARLIAGAAVAAKVNGTPLNLEMIERIVAAYRRALTAKPEAIEFKRAARLAAAAEISGRPMDGIIAEYRKVRDSKPVNIDQDRASVLVLASALSGAPIDQVVELYQEVRDARNGNAEPDAAAHIASAAVLAARERSASLQALELLTAEGS